MALVTLPSRPRVVPVLTVDPGAIRRTGGQLLAASSQVDDLGTFVAGPARIGDWHGPASLAYHDAIGPTGRQADAMSLALRDVAERVTTHADQMTALRDQRVDLVERRGHLQQTVAELEGRATGEVTPEELADLQDDCRRVQGEVDAYESDLTAWSTAITTEEGAMNDA